MKYEVQYVRVEHKVYFLEIEADNEDQASKLAKREFRGYGDYEVVHVDEFINQIDKVAA